TCWARSSAGIGQWRHRKSFHVWTPTARSAGRSMGARRSIGGRGRAALRSLSRGVVMCTSGGSLSAAALARVAALPLRGLAPRGARGAALLAAARARLLAAALVLVDRRVGDPLRGRGRAALPLRALLDVTGLATLLARVGRLAATCHDRL